MDTKNLRSSVGDILHSGVDLLVGNATPSEHLDNLNAAATNMLEALDGQPSTAATPPTTPYPQASRAQTSSPSGSASFGQSGSVSIDRNKLLQLVNMTRRFVRCSREGNIPSKEQRKYARRSIKAVKHLLPQRDPAQSAG